MLLLALSLAGMAQTAEQTMAAAAPEMKTVTATGIGSGTDKAKARDDAIFDAQRRAVEQGVGLYIKSEIAVENLQLLSDDIYTKAGGYVHTYKVLSEGYNAAGYLYRHHRSAGEHAETRR